MIYSYTAKEFIQHYGQQKYEQLIGYYLDDLLSSEEFKDTPNGEDCFLFKVFHIWDKNDKIIGTALIEGIASKENDKVVGVEITELSLTDEQMPDEYMDRYNEIGKIIDSGDSPV